CLFETYDWSNAKGLIVRCAAQEIPDLLQFKVLVKPASYPGILMQRASRVPEVMHAPSAKRRLRHNIKLALETIRDVVSQRIGNKRARCITGGPHQVGQALPDVLPAHLPLNVINPAFRRVQ